MKNSVWAFQLLKTYIIYLYSTMERQRIFCLTMVSQKSLIHVFSCLVTIVCYQGKKFQSNTNYGFGTDASASTPKKCAHKCHIVKTEGGYTTDTSGIVGSTYVETHGRFTACYCTFSLTYYPEEAYRSYHPSQSNTICIL